MGRDGGGRERQAEGWVPASCQPLSSCGTSVSSRRSGELLLLHYRSVTGRTLLAPTSALRQLVPLSPPPPPPIPLCLPLLPSPLSHHPSLSITLRTGNCRGVKKKIKVSYVSPTPDSTSLSPPPPHPPPLSVCLCPCLSVSVSVFVCLSVFFSLCVSLSVCLCLSLSVLFHIPPCFAVFIRLAE